jgi:type IV pilus assembly protein PilM
MVFQKLLKKRESLVGLDIGSSTIKLVELDTSGGQPSLVNIGIVATPADALQNNAIHKPESIADALTALFEENNIADKRVALSVPGASVFTKRVKMPRMAPSDLADNIQLEAGNFIPHNINAVKLDYHILGEAGKNQVEILVVAVKEEVLDSYLEALSLAGLEAAVADVDCFALQNAFEMNYGDMLATTSGLVNIGARFSSINICRDGQCLFTGDVSLGGKLFTEALVEQLGVAGEEAEQLKRGMGGRERSDEAREVIEKNIEYVASELNRQLSFFWSASGAEEAIDKIFVTGGGARVGGLLEELSEKTGIVCEYLNPLRGIEVPAGFDKKYLDELNPFLSVAVGLGIREPGDKIIPDFME